MSVMVERENFRADGKVKTRETISSGKPGKTALY